MHSLTVQRTAKDAAVPCAFLVSVSVQDQSSQGGFGPVLDKLWSVLLLLLEHQSATRQQLQPVTLLLGVQGVKILARRSVNTLLVFATASSAGISRELQETGRNRVFHFLASLFSATEQCESKKCKCQSCVC